MAQLTGTTRGVKTLSGGETFLASRALALALVELAGRGGGRLDALFLDEGFGSLDANALAEALELSAATPGAAASSPSSATFAPSLRIWTMYSP